MGKRLPVLSAVLLPCILCGGCGKQELSLVADRPDTPRRSPEKIISEMITAYGHSGRTDETTGALLEELSAQDSEQGRLWADIMSYWDYDNSELAIHSGKLPDGLPEDDSLALVVLGYALNADGTMQEELVSRLEVALACAEQYPNAYVLCTGGGTAGNAPNATEGGLMAEWLTANGLDPARIITEDESRTTAENAVNSNAILMRDYPQVDSVAIISSDYHIRWGALMFETEFLRTASERQTPAPHVISNCACKIQNSAYQSKDILRWETVGMLQLIGNDAQATQYYFSAIQ